MTLAKSMDADAMALAEITHRHLAALERAIDLTEGELGRPLAPEEIIIISNAIGRHLMAPDAPTTALQ